MSVSEEMRAAIAAAVARSLRATMGAGQLPDGSPSPPVSDATAARREARDEQAARGGSPSPRYVDADKRGRVVRNWVRHDRDPRRRQLAGHPSGVETGATADSITSRGSQVWIGVRRDGQLQALRARGLLNVAGTMTRPDVRQVLAGVLAQVVRSWVGRGPRGSR